MRLSAALVSSAASLALGSGMLISGCKSSQAVRAEQPSWNEPRGPSGSADVPAESRLAWVQTDMSPHQVQAIMGSPSGQVSYATARTFSPVGNDSGNRVMYMYKGQGRILFAVPKNGGEMTVLRVDVDSTEDGQ